MLRRVARACGWLLTAVMLLLVVFAGVFLFLTREPYRFAGPTAPTPSIVYADDGAVLGKLYDGHCEPVPLSRVPRHVIDAILTAEDRTFYTHHGIDFRGMARAAWVNLRAGAIRQGGSTITQQLVRITLLEDRRTWPRKVHEILLAVRVERGQTKSEILERYLNTIYFGGGAYGIGAAARSFFGAPVERLTPAQGAMLAGLVREPTGGNPRRNVEIAVRRQREILGAMCESGQLSTMTHANALREPLTFLPWKRPAWRAPYAVEMVRQELLARYGERLVYRGGLHVITTINSAHQRAAEAALKKAVQAGRNRGVDNAALIAIEPASGAIRALVGGIDFADSQFNRATQAHRQPGSAFKAFVYQAALEEGRIWEDSEIDAPLRVAGWSPGNYSKRYHGRVTLRKALALSLNSVAVRLTQQLSPATVRHAARRTGITSPLEPTLSIALGAYEVTPLEMARAFATYANGGMQAEPRLIIDIREGNLPRLHQPVELQRTVAAEIAYEMTEGLRGVITSGTGRRARIGRPAAGKTGTSNDYRDAWFVGYTPQLATAVWLGNDAHRPMRQVTGGSLPAQAWATFMRAAHRGIPPTEFPIPPGMIAATLCGLTGDLALPSCPHPMATLLPAARVPSQSCAIHYYVARRVCVTSRLLAHPGCPNTTVAYFPYDSAPTEPCALDHRIPALTPMPTPPTTLPRGTPPPSYYTAPDPPATPRTLPSYSKPDPKPRPAKPPANRGVPYIELPATPEKPDTPPATPKKPDTPTPMPPSVSLD